MLCRLCEKRQCVPFRQFKKLIDGNSRNFSSKKSTPESEWKEPEEGFKTGISIWNTLAKKKVPLVLKNKNQLSWYMCGPTVYDSAHIGHASSYIRFDIIRRVLENYFDIEVNQVMGITDIDDKIIYKANRTKTPFDEVAKKYEMEFLQDIEKLNILPATRFTRVSDHIPPILEYIQKIIDNGLAYTADNGSVYFDVIKYGRYGKLWTHSMETEVRATVDQSKKHPRDFALWKGVKPGEPYWESPWGDGRPGWHIECSAMASGVFGSNFDFHTGGNDLMFPHHENELAQSQAHYNCHQWVNYWLHTGHLHLSGDAIKMSKSRQNVLTISDFLDHFTANQFRMFCLLTPYRHYIEYSDVIMKKSAAMYEHFTNCINMCDAYVTGQILCEPINEAELQNCINETRQGILEALADDFLTENVISTMQNLTKILYKSFAKDTTCSVVRSPAIVSTAGVLLQSTLNKLGFNLRLKGTSSNMDGVKLDCVIDNLVNLRDTVRQFALHPPDNIFTDESEEDTKKEEKRRKKLMSPLLNKCDEVRDNLKAVNISIGDLKQTSLWKVDK
ncbi:hypothetical protein SNE40_016392 [Patella caerulea]|uniref:cysteine--tRNA ligase n=1 Tax=Patella caerulea TaxID=87958 RepID=A0AAN8JBC4_PATCE